ncbi:hypothetical protein LINPERPRIM_LOCUS45203 [Linum perenne]
MPRSRQLAESRETI